MAKKLLPRLPKAKTPIGQPIVRIGEERKRQYIAIWIERAEPPTTAAEISRVTGIDKGLLSRYINDPHLIPGNPNLAKLAKFLKTREPESLLRHPDEDWLTRLFRAANEEQKRRIMQRFLDELTPKAG